MEKQDVTSHSWQSMKYRYRVQLAKKQSEGEEANMKEEDGKVADKETKVIYLPVKLGVLSIFFILFLLFQSKQHTCTI